MTLDGFLTFLTLIIAIYAIMPTSSKKRVMIGWWVQLPLAVVSLFLVLYLEFFSYVSMACPSFFGQVCSFLILQDESVRSLQGLAFLTVVSWAIVALVVHRFTKHFPTAIPALARTFAELVFEKKYDEAVTLLRPHLKTLERASQRKFFYQRWLMLRSSDRFDSRVQRSVCSWSGEGSPSVFGGSKLGEVVLGFVGAILCFCFRDMRVRTSCMDIYGNITRSSGFLEFLASTRSDVTVDFLRLDTFVQSGFSDEILRFLIETPKSNLWTEIKDNQNLSGRFCYYIPAHNKILLFLFGDARNAEKLRAYKPIGDFMLRKVDALESSGYMSRINLPFYDFEEERWLDPVCVSLHFFDVMITSAAKQGVPWHMWLFYVRDLVKSLCETYDTTDPRVSADDEFPTRGARLIYEAICLLRRWMLIIVELPPHSPHRALSKNKFQTNNLIPVSAATALASCVRAVVTSDNINDNFKVYIHECVMRDLLELKVEDAPEVQYLRNFIIEKLIDGDEFGREENFANQLCILFKQADHVLRDDLGDYKEKIDLACN
ncbi:hypothetical protein [Thalassospira sp.]|uniref:hypothetical protein n=1 Tax=Thalassospira sp. TaxID=1912094 RepID=UPI003AA7EE6C